MQGIPMFSKVTYIHTKSKEEIKSLFTLSFSFYIGIDILLKYIVFKLSTFIFAILL